MEQSGDGDLNQSDTARIREYRRISTALRRKNSQLSDEERLDLARRLTTMAPKQPDSWWSVATKIEWMMGDIDGERLRSHPLFPELIAAWDCAIELDGKDAAAPYNKARALSTAGLLLEAYDAYMLAGRTELAFPSDVDWPADWHFESAAYTALELDCRDMALEAAQKAIEAGASDDTPEDLLNRLYEEDEARGRPT